MLIPSESPPSTAIFVVKKEKDLDIKSFVLFIKMIRFLILSAVNNEIDISSEKFHSVSLIYFTTSSNIYLTLCY